MISNQPADEGGEKLQEPQKDNNVKGIGAYFLFMLVFMVILLFTWSGLGSDTERMSDQEAMALLASGTVEKIQIEPIAVGDAQSGNVIFKVTGSNKLQYFYTSNVEAFRSQMETEFPDIPVVTQPLEGESLWIKLLPTIVLVVFGIIVLFFILPGIQGGGANGKMMNFGKSQARMITKGNNPVTFKDVAGSYEEKEEMQEIVDFLRNHKRFVNLGARIPKGVILVGPPGTGKTFLAKAVAGEAGVPFFSISGSDFVEMFVGVGASRVRDLFDQAKHHAPCIVFIDEIDAVGRRRGAGLGGGHDEREQTLNQLLVEMDGFTVNQGVIVMAATNRVDILDPALLRPGRFDRQIVVNRPDIRGRLEVLNIYAKGKPLAEDVDLDAIAHITSGFTPADLENLLNEAAILAARSKQGFITMANVQDAWIRVGVGTEKKSRHISEEEKRMTAYHEMGHAILFRQLPELDPVHSISIIPTGMAGGYTMPKPTDVMYMSKKRMKAEMAGLLGGRVAEEIVFDDITTGASNDIERMSAIARSMVTRYGMSENLGPLQFGEDDGEVFLGRDIGHSRNYGDTVADLIDKEVKILVDEAYETARRVLTENLDIMHKGVALLLEKEKITGEEFESLFEENNGTDNE